ncbi:MAG: branched-chain amino acid ABC transporter permease, partial [Geminicoccaceae bacterium]
MTTIFGAQTSTTISAPFGPVQIGDFSSSGYEIFLILVTMALSALVYACLRYTKLGLVARGTMRAADMAATLG